MKKERPKKEKGAIQRCSVAEQELDPRTAPTHPTPHSQSEKNAGSWPLISAFHCRCSDHSQRVTFFSPHRLSLALNTRNVGAVVTMAFIFTSYFQFRWKNPPGATPCTFPPPPPHLKVPFPPTQPKSGCRLRAAA